MNLFAFVAVWGFWALLVIGWWLDELHSRRIALFVLLWGLGLAALRALGFGVLFLPYVALLDVVLVLIIFQGDVTLR